ncbi:MAG: NAD-dependent epimerase/dehydratase family protein, partial [Colwellia sp.]|nr:NAD-dependent epimerase/dehydratase family protein [Colwellia sp.]
MSLLITGGTGYIGSHTVVELQSLSEEQELVIVDDLSNSSTKLLDRITQITDKKVTFIKAD